ncbi:uncharacterized protein LOC111710468 isoform X2 [Eurytemora carolleeae]|uniref:uncharacterized protein LOC111710468 isoform X2 n=1 Tax=Eurytemora carolleeae TaxID=1294199 RepID=UPI000C785410|nr:uncharacterized protein LOC111710468 isoform X2 [Eurytemora carolleeae]|eukprot:XP_023340337.1 uncharacterized protein LOC111710468 isoform X2 [Eurytemora affinis]
MTCTFCLRKLSRHSQVNFGITSFLLNEKHEQYRGRHTRRKTNNPLLLLSQKLEFIQPLPLDPLHRAGAPEPSSPEEPLISSGLESLTEEPESRTQTENDVGTDRLGSLNSFDSTSLPWTHSQSSLSRQGSLLYTSSYTSWTRPEAGHRISDCCVPNSSILDKDPSISIKPLNRSRSIRKKSSGRLMKRDGSADTSRDIDDIEDFEFDGGVDELVHDDEDLPEDDLDRETMKRSSLLLLESPDLAYVSMNPSADEFSK